MLTFTDRARAALKTLLDETEHKPGEVTRMKSDVHGNYHLFLGTQEEGDQVIEWEGKVVLVVKATVSEHLAEHLKGAVLDIIETPDGPVLDMPRS